MEEKKVFHSPSPIWTDEVWAFIQLETAKSFAVHKGCVAEIDKLYQKDKYRYYELSKQHPMYNFKLILSMKLEWQINCRHALGILWAADEDADLRGKLLRLIKRTAPLLYHYAVLPNRKNTEAHFKARSKYVDDIIFTGFTDGFIDYLLTWTYPSVDEMPQGAKGEYDGSLKYAYNVLNQKATLEKLFADHDPPTVTEKRLQDYVNSWAHVDFIVRFCNKEPFPPSQNESLAQLILQDPVNARQIVEGYAAVNRLFEIAGLTWENMLDQSPLDGKTHQLIVDVAYSENKKQKRVFDPKQYAYCIAMYRLIEEYGRTKEKFFAENEDNLGLELHKRDEQIQSLTGQLTALTEQNQRLKQENEQLKQNELLRRKEENDLIRKATKPLQKQVDTLQKQLRQIQEANYDNAELREFIFHLEDTVPEKNIPVDFAELSGRYKIATLGGHEILRNKLKEKFPDFKVLDGTQNSLDFSALLKCTDILFIFTGHMSHAVYEKAIAAVSQNNCKFYYINNATNLDIITAQMSRYLLESI